MSGYLLYINQGWVKNQTLPWVNYWVLLTTKGELTLMGNIPPRNILAEGSIEDVKAAVERQFRSLENTERIIFSCGGGMPPNTTTENIQSFVMKVKDLSNRR